MSRAPTPRAAPAFDSQAASASLKSAFQTELDAVHRAAAGADRPEIYKPPQQGSTGAWGSAGAWAHQPKSGAMADGGDFLRALGASYDKLAANAAPVDASKGSKK